MKMGDHGIISADDHFFEPADTWTSRAEPRFKDRVPRIARLEDGGDWWFTDGIKGVSAGLSSQVGVRFEGNEKLSLRDQYDHVRPGGVDPDARIKDMYQDGIDVSIIYPNQGLVLYSVPDTELLNAVFSIYNDSIAEHCSAHPKQLKGIAMINLDEAQWAVKEMERCHKLGLVGAVIPVFPLPTKGYGLPEYERFWEAAEDLGLPLSLHIATNRAGSVDELVDLETMPPDIMPNADFWVRRSLAAMIFSGVFERHPKLTVGSVEHDAGWVPYFQHALDYQYTQRIQLKHWHRYKENMLPSDYFRRNVFVGFQDDPLGIRDRHIIGVDNLQWGSDYPHHESTFPRSRQILEEILSDCTEDEKAKITGGNAARIYNLN